MTLLNFFSRLSLRQKFMIVLLPIIAILSSLMLWVIVALFQQLVNGLASSVALNRVQADSRQVSRILLSEVTVAQLLLANEQLQQRLLDDSFSFLNEADAQLLERYRRSFAEKTLFVAHNKSRGFYYFDDVIQPGAITPLYDLDASSVEDQWFFQAASLGPGCHLNIDYDRGVQLTKVWFNCGVLSENNDVIAVVGSGLELNAFVDLELTASVAASQKVFVDRRGAIQLHQDRSLITENAFTLQDSELTVLSSLIGGDAWRQIIDYFEAQSDRAPTLLLSVDYDGQQMILAVADVPELNWYGVVIVDKKRIVPSGFFLPIVIALVIMVAMFVMVLYLSFHKIFLQRLLFLDRAVATYRPGHEAFSLPSDSSLDEIGRLEQHVVEVSQRFFDYTQNLETLIQQRTQELQVLASTDELTGCANRRSFLNQFESELRRSRRHGHHLGLLVLDLDDFKQVNDEYGHAVGDLYLKGFVAQCHSVLRESDVLGRLGGDEFAVLLIEATEESCKQASDRLHKKIAQWTLSVDGAFIVGSVSIGYALMHPDKHITASKLMEQADKAMYQHKQRHRKRYNA